MSSRLFHLHLFSLWLSFLALIALTTISSISTSHRADCLPTSPLTLLSLNTTSCTHLENLSHSILHYSTYLQSINIIIIQLLTSLTLLTLRPYLLSLTWKSLERDRPTLQTIQTSITLADSPRLIPGILHTWSAKTLSPPIILVIFIATLSLISPLAVSSIYRPHTGPYEALLDFTGGGGIGPVIPPSYDPGYIVGAGITAGRSIIAAQSIDYISSNFTSPPGIIPFS
ncbi:hypothetical protein JAAARDRAFT_196822 [Jaapia argillacea MUCL 33604]|uniref:Uncharacterized protein n=1 Tax=Jaapia argillacea MUCL 33604 TaxID=933084 RepID=A0A067PGL6_9AGAM|nr:hypothetical protein JAAARDRAFT_196822 [Jaapia argillacea MUCL 33604]